MDFTTAVKTCFGKYVTFSGRAKRPEFWWFALFAVVGGMVLGIVDSILFGRDWDVLSSLFGLAILLPYLAVAVRRLHDIDRTGWWILIGLIPLIGFLVLIYFYVQQGTAGDNRFGPEPRA